MIYYESNPYNFFRQSIVCLKFGPPSRMLPITYNPPSSVRILIVPRSDLYEIVLSLYGLMKV